MMFCDLEGRIIMSDPLSVPFDCPNCGAKYEIAKLKASVSTGAAEAFCYFALVVPTR